VIVVVDTNVFVSALRSRSGASREVLRRCLSGQHRPLMGAALFFEYEAVLARESLFAGTPLNADEREQLFDSVLSVCRWTRIYYTWRPNLRDEADNHLIELAVAGGADALVTKNIRDFRGAQLYFPRLQVLRPEQLVKAKE